jgi:hypothetical protein
VTGSTRRPNLPNAPAIGEVVPGYDLSTWMMIFSPPGTPMALAPVAYTVWTDFLRYDPADPLWPNRDRFVLSCGHASMLLYSLIHLAGIRRAAAHAGSGR